jgi:hypothetical protein
MSSTWRIISFGSRKPVLYAQAARRLREKCESLGIDCYIPVIDFEIVERKYICLHKPSFILEQLKRAPIPTLWLDCDVALVGAPSLPRDGGWDIGFVPNTQRPNAGDFLTKAGFRQRSSHWVNTVSGFAVAFRPTQATFHFLEIWKYLCEWPDLASGGDHKRMCWARKMTELKEVNVARYLQGCVIRDAGKDKEHDLQGMHKLKLD